MNDALGYDVASTECSVIALDDPRAADSGAWPTPAKNENPEMLEKGVQQAARTPEVPLLWVVKEKVDDWESMVAYEIDGGDMYRVMPASARALHGVTDKLPCSIKKASGASMGCIGCSLERRVELDLDVSGLVKNAALVDGFSYKCLQVRAIGGKDELYSRNFGMLETDALASKSVLVVGVGSGGSTIAIELAKAGVGKFAIIDSDRVELSNVARHALDLRDLGRKKTSAMRDALLARNPHAEIVAIDADVMRGGVLDRVAERHGPFDLLVAATDTTQSRNVLNGFMLRHKIVGIFGRTVVRASGGDVMRVRPGIGPCLNCVFGGTSAPYGQTEADLQQDLLQYCAGTDDVKPVATVGLAADIAPVSLFMVKLALFELSRDHCGAEIAQLAEDLEDCDFWIWANRRVGDYQHFSPLGVGDSSFEIPNKFGERGLPTWYPRASPILVALKRLGDTEHFVILGNPKTYKSAITFHIAHQTAHWIFALTFDDDGVPALSASHLQDMRLTLSLPLINGDHAAFAQKVHAALQSHSTSPRCKPPYHNAICRWVGVNVPVGCVVCDPENHALQ